MRLAAILAAVVSIAGARPADASTLLSGTPVHFDFDSLAVPRGDFFITNYLSSLYGSAVATDGARTYNDSTPGDVFIGSSIQFVGRGEFEISFEEVPILAAQFEGHVIDATPGEDFRIRAFSGQTLVFSLLVDGGPGVFDSGWLNFGGQVDRLLISDSGRKDVGIDDFRVLPVPEPGAHVALTLLMLAAVRRRVRR